MFHQTGVGGISISFKEERKYSVSLNRVFPVSSIKGIEVPLFHPREVGGTLFHPTGW